MRFIHQQLNSFLNLGICKEYPIMARPPKNTSGGSAERPAKARSKKVNPDPILTEAVAAETTANRPEVKAATQEPASAALKPESRPFEVRKTEPVRPEAGKPESKSETRKPEVRKNIFPFNLEDEIRRRAYELYEERGYSSGNEAEDWLTAEREVLQRYHQHSA
jgi:Protein of unknown function (DUF2934)